MNLSEIAKTRYSTKAFDPGKKISKENFEEIKTLLQLSPSSVNSQPWHFILAESKEAKERICKGAQGDFAFNGPKMMNASHAIVFCAKTGMDDAYLEHLLQTETKDGRIANDDVKAIILNARNRFVDLHRYELKDIQHWMEKQVYLNMGTILLGAGALGIDAVPMEGLDFKAIDQEFELRKKGFSAVGVIALGYRDESDFNAKIPKSRLPMEEIFTQLD